MPPIQPKPRPANQVRQEFIDFFVQRARHVFIPSSPVVPHDDPTLLFANAGMNQFKPLFLGRTDFPPGHPFAGLKRAVNSQKCIRAGGKHNDLEDVGKDTYHHTFFEMLGNWSFGDYFKKESIEWGWELLTQIWGLDPNRMYATYFEGNKEAGLEPDREAYELWKKFLPASHILPGNMKDNFWEMGDTGPCGPCSEIHYDCRPDAERARVPGDQLVNRSDPSVIEFWNHVFIQFNRTGPGAGGLRPLPARHVDTGMGLERVTRIIQGKTSNYDTDVFTPLFEAIRRICKAEPYSGSLEKPVDIAYRVIADHIRTLTFAITDGAEPGSDGRGYVLRRILRRAVRMGRQTLGVPGTFLCELAPTVVETMGAAFPELRTNPARVVSIIKDEEEAFGRTLFVGLGLFEKSAAEAWSSLPLKPQYKGAAAQGRQLGSNEWTVEIAGAPGANGVTTEHLPLNNVAALRSHFEGVPTIKAEAAFKLHDTYGFPVDLTNQMAEERGMTVDVEGFNTLMEEAREKARAGGRSEEGTGLLLTTDAIDKLKRLGVHPTADLDKFHGRKIRARIEAIWNGNDFDENIIASNTRPTDRFALVLDKTCFYAEMGGQVADHGRIAITRERRSSVRESGEGGEFAVEDVRSIGGYIVHIGRIIKGEVRVGDEGELRLDVARRKAIASNHTSTHLLNLALRAALGSHVDQKGSLVAPDRLRFDFSHNKAVSPEEAAAIEQHVRAAIKSDLAVHAEVVGLAEARKVKGLRAVFGETYPDPVRLVSIGVSPAELLNDPSNERWMGFSAEFCGGTHLARTGEAEGFALLSEESVSKGIRRMTAVTGAGAAAAAGLADKLASRIRGAGALAPMHLVPELGAISAELDSAVIPMTRRPELRAMLAPLQEKIKEVAKQQAGAGRERAVAAARQIADSSDGTVIVHDIEADGNREALLVALDTVRARRPGSAVMLLSAEAGSGKVTIVAGVPEALIAKGLKAGDWVREASQVVGGKGGGRPDTAQGGGTDATKVPDAVRVAREFAAGKAR